MANNSTTVGGDKLLKQFWLNTFLTEFRNNLVFADLALKSAHESNSGTVAHWLSLADLTAAGAISEGFDPTSYTLSGGDLTASLSQIGAVVQFSDVVKDTWIKGSMNELMERMARNAADSIDTKIRDSIFTAGGTVQYAGTAVARNSIATSGFDASIAEFREATATLETAGVPRFDSYFAGVIHPHIKYDIQGDSAWTNARNYTTIGQDQVWKGEVGEMYGIRFMVSQKALKMVASGSASTDVYQSYIMGKEYFGMSELRNPEIIVKDPLPSSALNLASTVGWKALFALKELHSNGMIRLESGSALGN